MNLERCLPLTIDLLLNANEHIQWYLSKGTIFWKGKQMAKRKGQDGEVDTRWYNAGTIVHAHRFLWAFFPRQYILGKYSIYPSFTLGFSWIITIDLECVQWSKQHTLQHWGRYWTLVFDLVLSNGVAVTTWTQYKEMPRSMLPVFFRH